MKCPFCNQEVKQLAVHIKDAHPKKFSFLRKHRPELYQKLKREIEVGQMLISKVKNLFTLKIGRKTQFYRYKCVKCGNCCHEYDVSIQKEDIIKWENMGKTEFLKIFK